MLPKVKIIHEANKEFKKQLKAKDERIIELEALLAASQQKNDELERKWQSVINVVCPRAPANVSGYFYKFQPFYFQLLIG